MKQVFASFVLLTVLLNASGAIGKEAAAKRPPYAKVAEPVRVPLVYLGIFAKPGVQITVGQLQEIERTLRKESTWECCRIYSLQGPPIGSSAKVPTGISDIIDESRWPTAGSPVIIEDARKEVVNNPEEVASILRSGDYFSFEITEAKSEKYTCPAGEREAKMQRCRSGQKGVRAWLNFTLNLYRRKPLGDAQNPFFEVGAVSRDGSEVGFDFSKPAVKTVEEGEGALVEDTWPSRLATLRAARARARFISSRMKKAPSLLPVFSVQSATGSEVTFAGGAGDGVDRDDLFTVLDSKATGKEDPVGFVRVLRPAPQKESQEPPVHQATVFETTRTVHEGDLLVEYPMVGIDLGAHFLAELVASGFPFNGDRRLLAGLGLDVDLSVASALGVSQLYVSVSGDIVNVGDVYGSALSLFHVTLGLKKKFFVGPLAYTCAARAGMSYFDFSTATASTYYSAGAELVSGIDYYFSPRLALSATLLGRYFGNPLSAPEGKDSKPELGVTLVVGMRYGI